MNRLRIGGAGNYCALFLPFTGPMAGWELTL